MLQIRELEVSYGRIPVLRGVSLTVGNESVGLFGPNGAGKTTLINAIMGFLRPRAGTATVDGQDLTALRTHQIARAGIALVPQERELFPGMSVGDNLELGAVYIPRARAVMEKQRETVLGLFPVLRERYRQLAGTLSGGQQRMVAIGAGAHGESEASHPGRAVSWSPAVNRVRGLREARAAQGNGLHPRH